MSEWHRLLACGGAFGIAVCLYWRSGAGERPRFVLSLYAGALLAFVGLELFSDLWAVSDTQVLLRFDGASLLFVPLGVLLLAPWREALAALPLALLVARLGCLPYGCCYEAWWMALPELAAYLALHLAGRRWPQHTTPTVLSGFGATRLLSLPLRDTPAAELFVEQAWLAGAWIVAGVLLRHRIGTSAGAAEWFTRRSEPLLRALVLMLVVWLLFPLGAELFEESSTALTVGSGAALGLLLAVRRPLLPSLSIGSALVFAGALLIGLVVASLADEGLRHLGVTGGAPPFAGASGAFALVALAPVFEELLYRERLLGVLDSLWGWRWALVLSSALFALGHMDPHVMPIAFAGGLVCGVVMLRTGSLAAVIGLHAGWNLGVLGTWPIPGS